MDRVGSRGVALAIVLAVLIVVAALLTAAVALARLEVRAAADRRRLDRVFGQTELGLVEAATRWTPAALSRRLPGLFDSLAFAVPAPASPFPRRGVLRRLSQGLFLLEVTGGDPTAPGSDAVAVHLGWLLGVRPVAVSPRAALTARGAVTLGAGALVDGRDAPGTSWPECAPGDSGRAGLATNGPVTALAGASVSGYPPAVRLGPEEDSALSASQARWFAELASQAVVVGRRGVWATSPVASEGHCDVSVVTNWGGPDPGSACDTYLPIIRVTGDLTLLTGQGQGILLVEGDLEVQGDYSFWGLILLQGRLRTVKSPGTLRVSGALVVGGVAAETASIGGVAIRYSKCLISRALQSSGRLAPLSSRAWRQLY